MGGCAGGGACRLCQEDRASTHQGFATSAYNDVLLGASHTPLGSFGAIRTIVVAEGFFGLYRGIVPNLLKVAPSIGTSFAVYEVRSRCWELGCSWLVGQCMHCNEGLTAVPVFAPSVCPKPRSPAQSSPSPSCQRTWKQQQRQGWQWQWTHVDTPLIIFFLQREGTALPGALRLHQVVDSPTTQPIRCCPFFIAACTVQYPVLRTVTTAVATSHARQCNAK